MNKKMLFVLNPLSGKGAIKNHLLSIIDIFTKDGWDISVRVTQDKKDAFEYVRDTAADMELLVVSGGDGTLNECIRGVMALDEENRPRIGYIPAGTTNDFASSMKISRNMKKAAEEIVNGSPFKCDIGMFNHKNFIYVAAFGAFTDVAYETPQQNKNVLGQAAYVLEGAKKLPAIKPVHMKIIYGEGEIEGDFVYGMVSNTNYLGGVKYEKAFKAQLNDGLFEVILVKNPKNVIETQDLLARLVIQDFSSDAFVIFKTDKIAFISDKEVQWTLDGEFGGAVSEAEIVTIKQAVTLMLDEKRQE